VIEKQYDHNSEETAAAWDELPKLRAYLEAVGADPSLDDKAKWCGCRPSCLVPAVEKPKRMATDHPKAGSEPNNVRLCSLMFAYVRLIGKKLLRARRAHWGMQNARIDNDARPVLSERHSAKIKPN
jgi:hypothetical protein